MSPTGRTQCDGNDAAGNSCPNPATKTAPTLVPNGQDQDMRLCQVHYDAFRKERPPRVGPAR